MSFELVAVLGLLIAAIVMFTIDRPRMDAVALIVIVLLPLTGVVTIREVLGGFADSNVLLIATMFVLGECLARTGVARMLGDHLARHAGKSRSRLIAFMMTTVGTMGSTMSSTAITAIFIPVVMRIARITGNPPGKLMMPLSVAALVSGMTTLVATAPNLVVNAELVRRDLPGFGFFAFTPIGVLVLLCAVVYMIFASRWLPDGAQTPSERRRKPTLSEWSGRYRLAEREHRLRVTSGSPFAGLTLEEAAVRETHNANLVAIQRGGEWIQPNGKTQLRVDDILFVDLYAPGLDLSLLREKFLLEPLPLAGHHYADHSQEIGMAEAIIPADSDLVGKTMIESGFRSRFGLSIIGLRRGVNAIEGVLRDEKLRVGDTMLLIGPWRAVRELQVRSQRDLVLLELPAEYEDLVPIENRAWHAIAVLMLVIVMMVTGVVPNVHAALIGCLLMGVLGCIDLDTSYRAIDWKTIVLIVGMLPFSLALERTGGIDFISDTLILGTSGLGPRGVLACLFLLTTLCSLFISNTATAVLLAPVALTIADHMDTSPYPFAMVVAIAASTAFLTPVSSPVNTLVLTPGGYRFLDFVRIGLPLTLIVLLLAVALIPLLFPF